MKRRQINPGPGWRHIGSATWEHATGLRCTVSGMARTADNRWFNGMAWPEAAVRDWFIRANGGNRKRGTLAWALNTATTPPAGGEESK